MDYTWFCRVGERQVGPLTLNQVRRMAARGDLKLTSLIRRSDVTSWTEAGQIPDLWPRAAALPPEPVAPPPDVSPPPVAPVVVRPATVRGATPRAAHQVVPPPPPAVVPSSPAPPPVASFATPLATSPRAIPVRPTPIPVGTTLTGKPVGVPGTDAAATPAPTKAQERRQQARRKLYLLCGAAGGIAALAIVLGIVVSSFNNSPPASVADNSTISPPTGPAEAVPAAPASPATATAVVAPGAGASSPAPTTAAPARPPAASVSAPPPKSAEPASAQAATLQHILRTTAPWRDASSVTGVSTRSSRLQITGVWFAPLAVGGPEAADASEAANAADAAKKDAPSRDGNAPTDTKGPQVVCVELHISNPDKSEVPLSYTSWNLSGKAAQPPVVLVDSTNQPLTLIPVSKYPDRARQDKAVRMQPGHGVTDLLVFEAPTGDFEHLRLALRLSALGQGDKYLGFQLPKEMIAAAKPMEVADAPGEGKRSGARSALASKAGGSATPEAEVMPAEDAAPEVATPTRKEETILDLKRQIEEAAQEEKAAKDRERKKRAEEDKKKGDEEQADPSS